MYIGTSNSGNKVRWDIRSNHNTNNFALLTGKSGSGKTTLCRKLARDAVEEGLAVLILDYSGSYYKEQIADFYPQLHYSNVEIDGLGIKPFKPRLKRIENDLFRESPEDVASRITETLCTGYRIRGIKQKSMLREAILTAIDEYGENTTFSETLSLIKDTDLRARLSTLAGSKISKGSIIWNEVLQPGMVTVIQLSDSNTYNKHIYTELLLADLWSDTQQRSLGDYMLCLDEIQNLSFSPDSTVPRMLREARKYKVSMLLSTQLISKSNTDMRELLEQTALRFYFKPSDSEVFSTAKAIDNMDCRIWMTKLQALQVGQFVFTGNGLVGERSRDVKAILTH